MTLSSWLAIYFVIWWISLFVVLPWGVRSQSEEGDVIRGSDPGAPARPRLLRVVIANTILSLVILGIYYAVWQSGIVTLDDIPFLPDMRIKY